MGVAIEITGADELVQLLERRGRGLARGTRELFQSIGAEWQGLFQGYIREQVGPAGRFTALSPATQKRRKAAGFTPSAPILQRRGDLIGSIRTLFVSDEELRVGTAHEPALLLHFGGTTSPHAAIPNADVPARPFIGLDEQGIEDTMEMVAAYFWDDDAPEAARA